MRVPQSGSPSTAGWTFRDFKYYFSRRLAGSAPLSIVLGRDMLIIGTGLTLVGFMLTMILAANHAPTAWVIAAYFAAFPYNLFITIAVWRTAAQCGTLKRTTVRALALAWLVVATLV